MNEGNDSRRTGSNKKFKMMKNLEEKSPDSTVSQEWTSGDSLLARCPFSPLLFVSHDGGVLIFWGVCKSQKAHEEWVLFPPKYPRGRHVTQIEPDIYRVVNALNAGHTYLSTLGVDCWCSVINYLTIISFPIHMPLWSVCRCRILASFCKNPSLFGRF